MRCITCLSFFFFQAEDGIRDVAVTGVQTCALPICLISAFACAMTFGGLLAHAQTRDTFHPDRMDTVLYGVAYYPEYMPYDRLDQDVQLMQKEIGRAHV